MTTPTPLPTRPSPRLTVARAKASGQWDRLRAAIHAQDTGHMGRAR